ncbi:hypothetical protein Aperf_G00000109956 [Anoplocephala perfoliata]
MAKTATIPAILTRDSGSLETPRSGERQNMQLLTLPAAALSRSRGCSITSYRSEDAISNLSLGSLLQPDWNEDILSGHQSCLVLSQMQNIPLKDFSAEVRANMDIKMFIKEATLLLDMEAASIEEIIHGMLVAVFTETEDHANHATSTPSNIGSGTQRLFLTPNHSRRGSPTECDINNNTNGSTNIHSPVHTLNRSSGLSLFALAPKVSGIRREELIEEAKRALLLEIKYNDSAFISKGYLQVNQPEELKLAAIQQGQKKTKCDIELGRTFATILSNLEFRRQLIFAQNEEEVKALLCARAHELEEEHAQLRSTKERIEDIIEGCFEPKQRCQFMSGLIADLKRRLPLYSSDFSDGVRGAHTIRKSSYIGFLTIYLETLLKPGLQMQAEKLIVKQERRAKAIYSSSNNQALLRLA